MRRVFFLLLVAVLVPRLAGAAELILFDSPTCEWCEIWQEEVGVIYDKTDESRAAPLRRVSIHDPIAADLRFIRPVIYTPTFVLVENGHELGRITGYPGESHFWSLLGSLVEAIDSTTAGCSGNDRRARQSTVPSKETTAC